ncbi:glomulin-like [Gadus chalcogrammus]|uniref:glomulin-like n=1 Tax=Gadus chalcogrammus TaxID=1042646 RepID=UPI0024C4D7CC|nr:glomulin-like [Gadus chalcogrammus]
METPTLSVDQISDVIQKWRETPEEGWTPEDVKLFLDLGYSCIAQGDAAQLLTFLQDVRNKEIVQSMGCGLLAPLANEMTKKEKTLVQCEMAMTHLTMTCRPNELLYGLLKLMDDTDASVISNTIIALAPHLHTVLLRMGEGRAASLDSALSSIQKQLSRLPVPYTTQLEESDQYGLCRSCSALTDFVKPFVEEVKGKYGKKSSQCLEDQELNDVLLKFCMRCLREPIFQAQLDPSRKSPLWFFAVEIMAILASLQKPLADLVLYVPKKRSIVVEETQETDECRASFAYLLFVQGIGIDYFPAVFSPRFILQSNMEYINLLLSRKDESYVLKGLELYARSLDSVEDGSLTVDLLELKTFYSVQQNLRHILIECPSQKLRERSLLVLQYFINKLNSKAKHRFFRCMLKTSQHSGIEGYIVKNIKNQVEFSMKPGNENEWFFGVEFIYLLEQALSLPQGAETYLLQNMDRIMEGLNLLRYLLIRDKEWKSKSAAVWEELCRIKDDHLKMMRLGITMSRTYYINEAKTLREDYKLKAREARAAAKSTQPIKGLNMKHDKMADMSPEVQYQVIQNALVSFDLMESLIFRIEEIMDEKAKSVN